MNDWTSGYVADIGYTFGYYQELNPQRVRMAFLNAGLVAPEFGAACELGFGQGLSTNLHAAASLCSWHGTDFNPAQAGFAQELATISGANAQLYDEAFDELMSPLSAPINRQNKLKSTTLPKLTLTPDFTTMSFNNLLRDP
jgi:hypothetical protein